MEQRRPIPELESKLRASATRVGAAGPTAVFNLGEVGGCFRHTPLRPVPWDSLSILRHQTYHPHVRPPILPAQVKYRVPQGYIIPAAWQTALVMGSSVGRVVGGLCVLTGVLLLDGFLALAPKSPAMNNTTTALLIVWFVGYYKIVGPLVYLIVSETSSTRLRGHTTAIALIAYSILGIVYNISSPYLINASEAGLGPKTALIYCAASLLSYVWCCFNIPEC